MKNKNNSSGFFNGTVTRDMIKALSIQVLFGFNYFTFFLLPKYLDVHLDATAVEIGNVSSIIGIAIVAGMILVGIKIDCYGRKPYIIGGSFLSIVAALGFIWVEDVGPLLYGLRVLHGLSFAFVVNAMGAYITDITEPRHYGRALGYWGASLMVSNGIAPFLLEPVADTFGWNYVFIAAAGGGVLALFASFFLKERFGESETCHHDGDRKSLPRKKISAAVYGIFVSGAAFGILFTYYQPFAISIGINRIGGFFVFFTIAVIFSRTVMSGTADRYGRDVISIYSLVLYGVSIMAMYFLRTGVLEVIGIVYGLAHGLFFPAMTAFGVEDVNALYRGRVMTLTNSFFNIGFSSGIWLMGPVVESAGFQIVFIGTGIFVFTAIVPLVLLRRR
jgi:MFS family permease